MSKFTASQSSSSCITPGASSITAARRALALAGEGFSKAVGPGARGPPPQVEQPPAQPAEGSRSRRAERNGVGPADMTRWARMAVSAGCGCDQICTHGKHSEWAWMDSNHRPADYESAALTGLSYRPSPDSRVYSGHAGRLEGASRRVCA